MIPMQSSDISGKAEFPKLEAPGYAGAKIYSVLSMKRRLYALTTEASPSLRRGWSMLAHRPQMFKLRAYSWRWRTCGSARAVEITVSTRVGDCLGIRDMDQSPRVSLNAPSLEVRRSPAPHGLGRPLGVFSMPSHALSARRSLRHCAVQEPTPVEPERDQGSRTEHCARSCHGCCVAENGNRKSPRPDRDQTSEYAEIVGPSEAQPTSQYLYNHGGSRAQEEESHHKCRSSNN